MKTICFLGDSITRRGYWIAEIFEHVRHDGIKVYNCGVSGDSASNAIARLYTDCLGRSPDTVVMMFGMNDIRRSLYEQSAPNTPETEAKKAQALEKHQNAVRTLTSLIRKAGIDVILCTPTPYNDITPSELPKNRSNEGLAACAAFIRDLARELNAPCVDFFAELAPMLGKEYVTLPDLVHPTPESHHAMAQIFMRTLGIIDAYDPTPFLPMGELAQARFDAEQKLRDIHFIEWNQMYSDRTKRKMTHADFIALAESRLATARETGDQAKINWYTMYLDRVENRVEYESDVVRLTLDMLGNPS